MNEFERSDLACEIADPNQGTEESGVAWKHRSAGTFHITELTVQTPQAATRLQKPMGRYLTVECGRIEHLSASEHRALCHLLAGEMRGMVQKATDKKVGAGLRVFVAGLGNRELTPDSIGPKTVDRLTVTRHLREHESELYHSVGCCELSALATGVLGQTGIETYELLRGAIGTVKPDVILAIDALSARSCDRLSSTVQLSDAGIAPGSGVGNHRRAITKESMEVPVLAIGVPTVVNSATLVWDALHKAGIEEVSEDLRRVLESGESFFVSPRESDLIAKSVTRLLARAIEIAFLGELAEMTE